MRHRAGWWLAFGIITRYLQFGYVGCSHNRIRLWCSIGEFHSVYTQHLLSCLSLSIIQRLALQAQVGFFLFLCRLVSINVSHTLSLSLSLSLSVSVSCGEVHTCRSNSSCTVCCTCGLETIESKCDVFDGSPMLLLVVVLVLCE
jgi:hypothetical protein